MQAPDSDGLPDWFRRIRRVVDALTAGLNVLGTVLILALMVLVNMDVVGRGLFNNPVSGVPEMVSMSIVAIVFLQVAQTFRRGRLTRSEAILGFVAKYSPRARHAFDLVFSIAAILLIWQVLSASTPLFVKAWVRGTYEGTIGDFTAPVWPVKLIILIGCTALLVQLVLFGVAALLRLTSKAPA
ncbi:MAG: TRAP transporter small permease subunit [Rhodobacteraceae bacterium]|nr:TRAP transporter small permease subunit [Paracoccaceae bacterium]